MIASASSPLALSFREKLGLTSGFADPAADFPFQALELVALFFQDLASWMVIGYKKDKKNNNNLKSYSISRLKYN